MWIEAGTRLGPYEIVAPLGAGGMGQVYRARDTRLGRDVAVKVLPPEFAGDAERRRRFENEARAASGLNHPNVLHVYEIGSAGDIFYIAMELVEGRTLRDVMTGSPMPARKIADIAAPVADGLAKAHANGIVHRDLKPENIMVSNDGFVKILDFGLAKLTTPSLSDTSSTQVLADQTQSGALLGTVGYMSPEQASGRIADYRSDQFALGTILYEMAAGSRPFAKSSSAQTLAAIIEAETPPLDDTVPESLQRIIQRCLEKEPQERYAATSDLAHDLRDLRERDTSISRSRTRARRPRNRAVLLAAGAAMLLAIASGVAWMAIHRAPAPRFERLTFERGTIWSARFAPDGDTILYGASWLGKPFAIFSTRAGAPESRPFGIANADVLAISPAGQLAVSLGAHFFQTFQMVGTLARAPLGGGSPRPELDNVQGADIAPGGNTLAIVRSVGGHTRLEYPPGKVLHDVGGWIANPRIAPDGQHIAFIEHPVYPDLSGFVGVVDLDGHRTIRSKYWGAIEGLAWTPSGREIWFTASNNGTSTHSLNAVDLKGGERMVVDFPTDIRIQDIDRHGTVLFVREDMMFDIHASLGNEPSEADLSVMDNSVVRDLSADGKTLLILAATEGGANHAVYVRHTDGSPAQRIGDGLPSELSADGTWAVAVTPQPAPSQLMRIPVGTGEPTAISHDNITHSWANIFPDGKRVLFLGSEPGHGNRMYVQSVSGGPPQPISPEGTAFQWHAISPDGSRIVAYGPDHAITIYNMHGGAPVRTPLPSDLEPIRWTADGRAIYVYKRAEFPAKVYRADLTTGQMTFWRALMPADATGLQGILRIQITPDERAYAYSTIVRRSILYVGRGLH